MPLCTTEKVDCFDADDVSGFVPGIYDGSAYRGAVGDHVRWAANNGSPVITNVPEFWQPGHFINFTNKK